MSNKIHGFTPEEIMQNRFDFPTSEFCYPDGYGEKDGQIECSWNYGHSWDESSVFQWWDNKWYYIGTDEDIEKRYKEIDK